MSGLPNHWNWANVGEIADCSLGKMLDRNKNQGTPRPYLRNINVRWFEFDLSDLKKMRFEASESEKFTAQRGDVMVCEGGYPGRAAIWGGDDPIHFQKAIHRVRFHELERNKWFLYYLHYLESTGKLSEYFTGTGIKHFTGRVLKKLPIPLPPLSEQRRIVSVLDAAFAGLATATAHTHKNLQNARELLDSHLYTVFSHDDASSASLEYGTIEDARSAPKAKKTGTRTGGRAATDQHIPGPLSLAVNRPKTPAKSGWRWTRLSDLARLETGHTPSRKHPEWWGGKIPWIGIKDAKAHHGTIIHDTLSTTNDDGIANSAARVLPPGTVCLSRTASVGYVTVMGKEMATSQDFVNWVCSEDLEPHFLKYLLVAEGDGIRRFGSGSVHTTIYFPEVKAFYVCCPSPEDQRKIVDEIEAIKDFSDRLKATAERKLAAISELKQSILHCAFRGELAVVSSESPITIPADQNQGPFPFPIDGISSTDLHAGILALAHESHTVAGKIDRFGHVKAEKQAHMIEAVLGIDLGRRPMKDAMGPNDFPHLQKVEHRARMAKYFNFKRDKQGGRYQITKYHGFDRLLAKTRAALGDHAIEVERLLQWMTPLSVRQAEIVATVYAGWNNLLIDGHDPTDEDIVTESRENWHPKKLEIGRDKFFKAIDWLREQEVVPIGRGRKVEPKADK